MQCSKPIRLATTRIAASKNLAKTPVKLASNEATLMKMQAMARPSLLTA
jgi:hypothetical protein